jgi:hypothetical protein
LKRYRVELSFYVQSAALWAYSGRSGWGAQMAKAIEVGNYIVRLSAKHEIDPFAVVGILAIHALADVDFKGVRFWNQVCDGIRAQQAA